MYNITKIYGKKDGTWALTTIAEQTIGSILQRYDSFRVVSTYNDDPKPFEIHSMDNEALISIADKDVTLTTWLSSFTTPVLTVRATLKSLSQAKTAIFTDLYNYALSYGRGNHMYADGLPIPLNTDIDIKITSNVREENERSTKNLGDNAIISINGRLVETTYAHGNLYAIGAAKQALIDNNIKLSILDFTDVGGLNKQSITIENMTILARNQFDMDSNSTRVKVTMPEPLSGQTILAVLDGILIHDSKTIRRLNNNEVVLTIDHEAALKRASRRAYIELDFVTDASLTRNGLISNSFDVEAFLDKTDSFMVMVQSDELCINKELLSNTKIPGFYTYYRYPKGPIFFENGMLVPYHVNDYNQYTVSISVGDNQRRHWSSDERYLKDQPTLTNTSMAVKETILESMQAWAIDFYVF